MATVKTFLTILNLLLYSCFCSDMNCKDGECKPIKDTTQVFCECEIPYEGCRSQDLQWVQTREVPSNAVRSKTHLAVCKAIGPDSGWHSGFVKNQRCNYEYDWSKHQADNYEVLVDPCGGSGWKWVEGEQQNMVSYDKSVRFQGLKYYVCSGKSDGLVGKLFNTRNGFLCHIAKDNTRDEHFYTLVPQPCI